MGNYGSPIRQTGQYHRRRRSNSGFLLGWLLGRNSHSGSYGSGSSTYSGGYGSYGSDSYGSGSYGTDSYGTGSTTTSTTTAPKKIISYVCPYCDSSFPYNTADDQSNICPNCGARMEVIETELPTTGAQQTTASDTQYHQPYQTTNTHTSSGLGILGKIIKLIILFPIVMLLLAFVGAFIFGGSNSYSSYTTQFSSTGSSNYSSYDSSSTNTSYPSVDGDSIFVDEIGRTCYWDEENGCYYDQKTDCYFLYDESNSPATWQYWYEDISSDFGDYGWMEYDTYENRWYIEKSYGNWIPLPSKYDTSKLWHIQ